MVTRVVLGRIAFEKLTQDLFFVDQLAIIVITTSAGSSFDFLVGRRSGNSGLKMRRTTTRWSTIFNVVGMVVSMRQSSLSL